jgi:CO dehydrogenase/acetyl-CoA synthase epsilon subunit
MNCKYIVIFLAILVASCTTTKYIEKPVEVEKIKTEYITKYITDSIYTKDSVDRYIINDTIYIYKEKIRTRYINKHDTISKVDSIPYYIKTTVTEVKEVNKVKWYQMFLMLLGGVFICYIIYKNKNILKNILT